MEATVPKAHWAPLPGVVRTETQTHVSKTSNMSARSASSRNNKEEHHGNGRKAMEEAASQYKGWENITPNQPTMTHWT